LEPLGIGGNLGRLPGRRRSRLYRSFGNSHRSAPAIPIDSNNLPGAESFPGLEVIYDNCYAIYQMGTADINCR
jgi:hypothetical protein